MNEKVTFWKIAIISIFVFLFGYFAGNVFDFKEIIHLEGYKYSAEKSALENEDATSSDATSSNATSCNATSSDATSSNATSCNATSSNATSDTVVVSNTTSNNVKTLYETSNNENISFENNKITATQIKEIKDSSKPINITLNCDNNSIVTSSVFDAVKESNSKLTLVYGKNKMSFLGNNITELKDIDFKASLSEINTDNILKEFTNNGLVLEFPNNNQLPGNALVSINIDAKYNSYFSSGILSVYYYNETTGKLELVVNNIKIIDNTIEFTINHNSSYVLTSGTVKQEKNTEEIKDEVVKFVNNKLIYIAVIGVSIILIVTVTIIVLIKRKKKFGKMF